MRLALRDRILYTCHGFISVKKESRLEKRLLKLVSLIKDKGGLYSG